MAASSCWGETCGYASRVSWRSRRHCSCRPGSARAGVRAGALSFVRPAAQPKPMRDHGGMRLLLPEPRDPVTDGDLLRLYAWPRGRVLVRANMVTTIDGAISGAGGTSGRSAAAPTNASSISSGHRRRHRRRRRDLIAEDYGPVRHDAALARPGRRLVSPPYPSSASSATGRRCRPMLGVFTGGPGTTLMVVSPRLTPHGWPRCDGSPRW